MSASKLIRALQLRDTPEAVAERIAYREDAERAVRERKEKFGPATVDNFQAASDWQATRIAELQASRAKGITIASNRRPSRE